MRSFLFAILKYIIHKNDFTIRKLDNYVYREDNNSTVIYNIINIFKYQNQVID